MAPISLSDVMGIRELAVTVVFMLFATLSVLARLWARQIRKSGLRLDDWITVIAMVLMWGVNISSIVAVIDGGAGQGAQYVDPDELLVTGKLFAAYPVLWGFAVAAVKVAILSLYLTIFRVLRAFQIATYIMMGISIAYGVSVVITGLTICQPISYQWDPDQAGFCGDKILFYVWISGIYVVIDTATFLLPIPMLWKLQMPTSRKIALTSLFGIGLAACVTTIIRIFAIKGLSNPNIAYTSASDWIWCVIELDLSLMIACLPVLQPVWGRLGEYFSRVTSLASRGSRGSESKRSWYSGSTKISDKDRFGGKEKRRGGPVEAEDQLYPLSQYGGMTMGSVGGVEGDVEGGRGYSELNGWEVERGFKLSYADRREG